MLASILKTDFLMTVVRILPVPSLVKWINCVKKLMKRSEQVHSKEDANPHLMRAILKNGGCNVLHKHLYSRWIRFFKDPFTTLIDLQWRWCLMIFYMSYVLSWLIFSALWWFITVMYEAVHLLDRTDQASKPQCYTSIKDFTSSLLFSIDIQTTMGHSLRTITDECPEAIFLIIFQFIFGMIQTSFVVGFLFAKISQSKYRTQTLLFSRKAVISQRNDNLYLMFRVGDMRKSHFINTRIRAQVIWPRKTHEGDLLPVYHTELKVADDCSEKLLFKWPEIICHKIDETSPFFHMSKADVLHQKFEIVVILEGIIESTGHFMQARTSYLNDEIFWGRRFVPVVRYKGERHAYDVNYSDFETTEEVNTHECSSWMWTLQRLHYSGETSKNLEVMNSPILFNNSLQN